MTAGRQKHLLRKTGRVGISGCGHLAQAQVRLLTQTSPPPASDDPHYQSQRSGPILAPERDNVGTPGSILSMPFIVRCARMNPRDAADVDRAAIASTTAELLTAVNASDAVRCGAVWAADGVLM